MKKVINVMKKIFVVVISIIGVLELAFMIWAATQIYEKETLHFDHWYIYEVEVGYDDAEKNEKFHKNKEEGNYLIETFNFSHSANYYDQVLCYNEIEDPVRSYSMQVLEKYEWKANLHIEAEYTPKIFTVKFTGWGYPENGEPECLDRTYTFDIEGAGPDKLPVMLNKDEYFV